MSWCRWSTDSFRCDLYIYDSVGDFVSVNVAGRRKWFCITDPSAFTWESGECAVKTGWPWIWYRIGKWLHRTCYRITPWRRVNYSGEQSLQFTDMKALCEWLQEARDKGLRFPDRVWSCLLETALERQPQPGPGEHGGSSKESAP